MRITKFGHACVRIEYDEHAIVIDPGSFTEREAVEGATALLITHEHADHYDVEHLRATDAQIHTIGAVAVKIAEDAPDLAERTHVLAPGERFDPGVPTLVVGEKHAVIHPELPHFDNSGFLLDLDGTRVYHPGDSLTVPEVEVDLLLLPVSAPWLKVSECIDFARAVRAPRSVGIHDKIYTDVALEIVRGHLDRFLEPLGISYTPMASGQDIV